MLDARRAPNKGGDPQPRPRGRKAPDLHPRALLPPGYKVLRAAPEHLPDIPRLPEGLPREPQRNPALQNGDRPRGHLARGDTAGIHHPQEERIRALQPAAAPQKSASVSGSGVLGADPGRHLQRCQQM